MHEVMIAAAGAQALSLVALWLRLRWRLREERARRGYVVAAARALPPGSRFQDRRADGSSVTLIVAADPDERG